MKLYLASGNAHKLAEFRVLAAASGLPLQLEGAQALGGMPPVEESAGTFEGNARLKAEALRPFLPDDGWVLADDSGLEVDALGGAPGVYSSRYAGANASDRDNLEKLLRVLGDRPPAERKARFHCVLVLQNRAGAEEVFHGCCEGRITAEAVGTEGFGYDPAFQPDGHEATFGQLGDGVKARLSHRARAFAALLAWAENPE
jgi:XTP/dITP diphosphohydrolase